MKFKIFLALISLFLPMKLSLFYDKGGCVEVMMMMMMIWLFPCFPHGKSVAKAKIKCFT